MIYRLFLDGTPIRSIARHLNARYALIFPTGSATRQAGQWPSHTVHYVLGNPVYAGILVMNKTIGVGPRIPRTLYPTVRRSVRQMRDR